VKGSAAFLRASRPPAPSPDIMASLLGDFWTLIFLGPPSPRAAFTPAGPRLRQVAVAGRLFELIIAGGARRAARDRALTAVVPEFLEYIVFVPRASATVCTGTFPKFAGCCAAGSTSVSHSPKCFTSSRTAELGGSRVRSTRNRPRNADFSGRAAENGRLAHLGIKAHVTDSYNALRYGGYTATSDQVSRGRAAIPLI